MNRFSSLPVVLFLVFVIHSPVWSQNQTSEVDSTYETYINEAWQEIEDAEMSDSLQVRYAKEFYEYYLNNPDTRTGEIAIRSSFMMWGNTGTSDYIDDALQTLDYDSELWDSIIFTLGNLLPEEEHTDLLGDLAEGLTDPRGKSEAVLALLREETSKEDYNQDRAKELARQLVEINATEFHVNQGLGYLHEFEFLNIGQKGPDFRAKTVAGRELSLTDLRGNFILLEFWATWCGPCIPEIPYLKTLSDKYQDDNFEIIGISLDRDRRTLENFIKEKNLDWPQVFAEGGWEGEIPRLYNVSGIPRMYLLNPEGTIIARDLKGEAMITEIDQRISEYSN